MSMVWLGMLTRKLKRTILVIILGCVALLLLHSNGQLHISYTPYPRKDMSVNKGLPDKVSDKGLPDKVSDKGLPDKVSDKGLPDKGLPVKVLKRDVSSATLRNCTEDDLKLVGPIPVEMNYTRIVAAEKKLEETVNKGGWWQPDMCAATAKVAIIIPFRNREVHLKYFLHNMHPFLQKQKLFYRIIVIEQQEGEDFNRAGLINIGFVEALKMSPFDCFVFHDIDHLPENDNNYYGCPSSPSHMSSAIDKHGYKLLGQSFLGGVFSMTKEHYEKTNGMSNLYFGWGGEDDDMYSRVLNSGYRVMNRPSNKIGRYKTIKIEHHRSGTPNPIRKKLKLTAVKRKSIDGLNTLKYNVKDVIEYPLVTFVKVDLKRSDYFL